LADGLRSNGVFGPATEVPIIFALGRVNPQNLTFRRGAAWGCSVPQTDVSASKLEPEGGSDLEVTYEAIRSGRQIDHSIGAYINRISELDANNVYSLPIPANPAYELSMHCLPYSLRP
jgi:hypothetical protein